ncbi:ATP synthase subunit beta [Frankliniella fusca]|uniref:ATP synthase subunit beta n=1 Tax=Frankliniella fusca TaxID=407009 RepID=A0AAE1H4H2_9NEOP|nr:ATP synthase subunit beta [Frankliniella fusca]KAK3928907.1 ATP synthase subunit beta [Frankliniella fusca]
MSSFNLTGQKLHNAADAEAETVLLVLSVTADAVLLFQEEGYRGNSYFYHTGPNSHAYHVNVETEKRIYFRCVFYDKLKCWGRAILEIGGGYRQSSNHNHPPDPDFVAQRHFRQNVVNRVREGRYVGFAEILESERRNRRYSRRVRRIMTMRKLRNPMYRARIESFPPVPESLRDLTRLLLRDEWREKISCTVDKDDNLYCGSTTATDNSHHVAFISARMRRFASRISILQSDGTFRARPQVPHSAQVFVLVTPWRNVCIPIGWILMERRTIPAYRAVFQLLKEVCPDLNPSMPKYKAACGTFAGLLSRKPIN